jgi:uncharacterized protein YdiU (UPF0061 family)
MKLFPFQNTYVALPERFYERVEPATVPAPSLIRFNEDLAGMLGLDRSSASDEEIAAQLGGNVIPEGAEPLAQAYGGHQFGGWVPRLGDGRALLLGEVIGTDGVRRDVQLKGSGRTPFSRGGDGKSPLGPVLREYLVSEAMFALGVPTTRSLAAVATGEPVYREDKLPGAVLTRVASSHLRIGTFQYFLAQEDHEALRILADYAIERHYPGCESEEQPYTAFLGRVIERQAALVAQWMSLGFIHGVMNTDNMTISGETIDFGPCAFVDEFHPEKVFSSIDRNGRYAWGNQPAIAHWNLTRLAEALLPLFDEDREKAIGMAEERLGVFEERFKEAYYGRFRAKLGWKGDTEKTGEFVDTTLEFLSEEKVDFTLFFRELTRVAAGEPEAELIALSEDAEAAAKWLQSWREQGQPDVERMRSSNPILIPRNHRIEQAIVAANGGDYSFFHRLADAYQSPFDAGPDLADLEQAPGPEELVCATFCGT